MAVLAVLYYYLLIFLRGTRGAQVLLGMVFSLASLFALSYLLKLTTLYWMLQQLTVFLPLAFLVIFQPEIRRALAELGTQHVFSSQASGRKSLVEPLVETLSLLSSRKIGALIAIEREVGIKPVQESGTQLESLLTPELLTSLFFPNSPLHDGGVIISGDRIMAAGCLFPLSQRDELSRSLGTRHRAAIGLTEESDAVVLVVSEETGTISIAHKGKLSRGLDEEKVRRMLNALLVRAGGSTQRLRKDNPSLFLTQSDDTKSGSGKAGNA